MATTNRNLGKPVMSLLSLILFIGVVWVLLAVVKGTLGAILTVLLVMLAAVVIWRLLKAGFHKST